MWEVYKTYFKLFRKENFDWKSMIFLKIVGSIRCYKNVYICIWYVVATFAKTRVENTQTDGFALTDRALARGV